MGMVYWKICNSPHAAKVNITPRKYLKINRAVAQCRRRPSRSSFYSSSVCRELCDKCLSNMELPSKYLPKMNTPNIDLESILNKLGMQCYLHRFMNAGFDDWVVVKDITEKDMQVLGFQLGHIRKLQREIATSRGWPKNAPLKATCVCCGGRENGRQKQAVVTQSVVWH
ncbi:cf1a5bae-0fee-4dbb-be1b-32dcbcb8554c [Sclerotinia trifoliorum]|uniref:Cf1a5bae-0fee-4dbb-be1b-32dcbcb8554c n=1 Tax=Sclerotinia trifoliorum TaxID=28548 RepID=A0A8H2VW08_9HELO|nr:cf1a5bae-0fee-4dbb-be1b-32dcbcb8554c [Sclerotinia trifoliorum]